MEELNYWRNFDNEDYNLTTEELEILPLTHNLRYGEFQRLLLNKEISLPKESAPVFDKPLVFFYYGIPAYYKKSMISPVIILFEPEGEIIEKLNWSPIDTGAYDILSKNSNVLEFMSGAIDKDDFKDEFILKKHQDKMAILYLKEHLSLFFKTNERYLYGKNNDECLDGLQHNENLKTVDRLFKFHKSQGLHNSHIGEILDRRIKILEGHSETPIQLNQLKPFFCYIPKYGRKFVKENLQLDDNNIIDYDGELIGSTQKIIEHGMLLAIKFLEKRLKTYK